ncbi:DUF202 domain-containing protein [Kocuria massiliensis]|uniref:DUF202 domain-containing protein n=1 Tax=Kocuria massiliensis TaxID=1926282 RepID=UPI00156D57A5|nr:DUF202 domain-containing protein [Kocuria massiliensis]
MPDPRDGLAVTPEPSPSSQGHLPGQLTEPADPGLQPERTVLAWGRTVLAVGVIGASFLRWVPTFGPWVVILSLLAALTSTGIYLTQRRRYRRQSHGLRHGQLHADPLAVGLASLAVAVMSVIAVVFILVSGR